MPQGTTVKHLVRIEIIIVGELLWKSIANFLKKIPISPIKPKWYSDIKRQKYPHTL